ncbi:MAG: DUF4303 domain-containing protein [Rubripirellula sp.]|nr:DUF4303 domain-containing protein [Rubripirellula sp.]
MIPAGVMLIVWAMRGDGVFPQGVWQGPILVVLGLLLIIISVRRLLKGDEPIAADQPLPANGGVDFNAARRLFRDAICNTIEKILPVDFPNQAVYGFILATMDDCDHTMVFATSLEALEPRLEGVTDDTERAFQKWYAGEWGDDLGHISFQEGEKILSLDSYDDDSAESRRAYQARRLWVMTKALKDVADQGGFNRGRQPITAFCTMFDDENAVWLERESARYINKPEQFDAFAPEQVLAASRWYRDVDEPRALAEVFQQLMRKDEI